MIDPKTLRELVKLMVTNDLTELDLQDGKERVCLKRGLGQQPVLQYVPAPTATVGAAVAPTAAAAAPAAAASATGSNGSASGDTAGLVAIPSPMVGTFYAAASPDAKPFVKVGDRVTPESVVCIIEAMKVFNEIKAEMAGTIEKILVSSGQAVEFGQPLFMVRP